MQLIRKSKITLLAIFAFLLTSCGDFKTMTKNNVIFTKVEDSLLKSGTTENTTFIQKGDILYISVNTANEESSKKFNQQNFYAGTSIASGSNTSNVIGYLVDENGEITFPFVGKLKVEGLKKSDLAAKLNTEVVKYVSDAIVSVRIMNYKITVLGEVARPGTISIPNERVSVIEAIGMAGDFTPFAKRHNVKIIREINGIRSSGLLDLNDGNIFNSPYYYLQQNDIVYIELNDRKLKNIDQANTRNASLILGIVSASALVVTTIINLTNN